jgi:hypothetical protein
VNEDFKLIRKILGNLNKSRIILGFKKSTELHGIARVKFFSACVKAFFFGCTIRYVVFIVRNLDSHLDLQCKRKLCKCCSYKIKLWWKNSATERVLEILKKLTLLKEEILSPVKLIALLVKKFGEQMGCLKKLSI